MARGRRLRNVPLASGTGQRILPPVLEQRLNANQAVRLTFDQLELLEELGPTALRGAFADGYTETRVGTISTRLRDATGFYLTVVWEYRDRYGCGGGSEEFLADAAGETYAMPSPLADILSDVDAPVDVDAVEFALSNLEPVAFANDLVRVSPGNYVLTDYGMDNVHEEP